MKVSRVTTRQLAEARFAQIMDHIATKHGCTCRIDWDTYCVHFEGPIGKKEAIANELEQFFAWGCV